MEDKSYIGQLMTVIMTFMAISMERENAGDHPPRVEKAPEAPSPAPSENGDLDLERNRLDQLENCSRPRNQGHGLQIRLLLMYTAITLLLCAGAWEWYRAHQANKHHTNPSGPVKR